MISASAVTAAPADDPVILVVVLVAVSLLPFAAMMLTSFVKIAVVLSIVRSAFGAQQLPPTSVITGLAVVLSLYVMSPVIDASRAVLDEIQPNTASDYLAAADRASAPLHAFLTRHSTQEDRETFARLAADLRGEDPPDRVDHHGLLVVMPAFVISELREAFRIGFVIFLPFLVVDLAVSCILLALGMHMLSPTTVSLPFKLMLFVLTDGWLLLSEALVRSYLGP